MSTRILTGITTTGTPHLGNYVGAIRPAIASSAAAGVDAFFFLADYHALIKCDDPARIERSRLEIAATWLAAGLDPERVTFYRQSDLPEVAELCWVLTCVTAKGLMNRAHAYKAAVDQNTAQGAEPDDGITMGLFSYPVLMAADILIFNAHQVPVGRDQLQHLEMTRDIAQRFNYLYGAGKDIFTLPEAVIDDSVATLPGLDGRKMSKSYNNTIPLFEGGERALRDAIARIVTDSRAPGEPKDADTSHLYPVYRAFATAEQSQTFRAALHDGMAWGEAKRALADLIQAQVGPMREKYQYLIDHPDQVEDALQHGARKARQLAAPLMDEVRRAIGLRSAQSFSVAQSGSTGQLSSTERIAASARQGSAASSSKEATVKDATRKSGKLARFVSFRENDGTFRFRLLAADGQQLLLSIGYGNPKNAGAIVRQLQQLGASALQPSDDNRFVARIDGQLVAQSEPYTLPENRDAALAKAKAELAALAEQE